MRNPISILYDAARWRLTPRADKAAIFAVKAEKAEALGAALEASSNPDNRIKAREAFLEASGHYHNAAKNEPSEDRSFFYEASRLPCLVRAGVQFVPRGP